MAINFDYTQHLETVIPLLTELEGLFYHPDQLLDKESLLALQKKHNLASGQMLSKTDIIAAYKGLAGSHGLKPYSTQLVRQIRMKPIRTMSGVAPVTVLTKPYPCPGQCLFCPSDVRMPKSYLASEPGAQRAENNFFDPYLQTYNRIKTLHEMGHPIDKVELIVLGGSWTYYPLPYQIWFVTECFRAMNQFGQKDERSVVRQRYQQFLAEFEDLDLPALTDDPDKNEQIFEKYQFQGDQPQKNYNQLMKQLFIRPEQKVGLTDYQTADWTDLEQAQKLNETAQARCVGLVLETRPDEINFERISQLRRLGATKIQLGVQFLDDQVLQKNLRGHGVAETARAMALLRLAGFKLHIHWMPNLFGSSVEQDKQDYLKLFSDERFKPDEIKIYPCSLIESAGLMRYFQSGEWQPYTHDQLLEILTFCLTHTPPYCRVTRVVRDIPAFDIVAGNKKSNFRQIAASELKRTEQHSENIRAREIRGLEFDPDQVYLDEIHYKTSVSEEIFLQYVVETEKPVQIKTKTKTKKSDLIQGEARKNKSQSQLPLTKPVKKVLGFLRLSLPSQESQDELVAQAGLFELSQAAIIREVHVYGQLVGLGQEAAGRAQHLGLGSKLIERAKQLATEQNYPRLAVISAIGTKKYYRERGFEDQGLYQVCSLSILKR
ncbi:MAG: tRNA uridine(34) 5-carboxymethylaminomethyl modification radical SAM/GNAT enzyme Elp3 [Candidatus Pacebacteria bacterium]|nr:tRNA uridine(34) 5-carboxymethylaminomethyl modification radical SAM/GNAT enzyme Elp3 [Candidatus Paceibacterota bacterium]